MVTGASTPPSPITRGRRMTTTQFRRTPRKRTTSKSAAIRSDAAAEEEIPASTSVTITARPRRAACPVARALSLPQSATILPRRFFEIDAVDLAPRLLGKFLRRDEVVLQITEVEAYRPNDTACHGRFGITARTAPVFGPGGHAYVYLCYGLHMMLNIVADKDGVGAAVLVRSCAPVNGLETIQARRGQMTDKPILLTGPGKM